MNQRFTEELIEILENILAEVDVPEEFLEGDWCEETKEFLMSFTH